MQTQALEARMTHPVYAIPDAMEALQALHKAITRGGVDPKTLELVNLRASQINGCGVCVVQHPKIARKLGETDERLFAVAAWREAPYFTDAERAAWRSPRPRRASATARIRCPTRSGTRRPATTTSRRSPRSLLNIANINVWNRLNVATRQVAGQEW